MTCGAADAALLTLLQGHRAGQQRVQHHHPGGAGKLLIVLSHMLHFDSKNMQSEAHCPIGPGIPE
jgi:hypothetical protein